MGSARVVTVANEKGGVAKTTTVLSIADGLARRDRRVLVVDMDPQDCVRKMLSLPKVPRGMDDVLVGRASIAAVRVKVVRFWCATAGERLREAETAITGAITSRGGAALEALRMALDPYRDEYDYVIVDTGPALGGLTTNAIVAADGALIPFVPELVPYEQALNAIRHVQGAAMHFNHELSILGLVPTMVRRVSEHQDVLAKAGRECGQRVFAPVPQSTKVSTFFSLGGWQDQSDGASETARAAAAAYGEVVEAIEAWRG